MQTSGRTDRPSVQFIYRWPRGEMVPTARISEQLEVRAHGAQIVVAPSIHPSGSEYRWLIPPTDVPDGPPDLPQWVLDELTRPRQPAETAQEPRKAPQTGQTLAQRRLDGLVEFVAQSPEGDRNNRLNHAAYTAARIPGLTDDEITSRLTAAAQTIGLEDREIAATLKSGIESGHKDGPDPEHIEPGSIGIKLPTPSIVEGEEPAEPTTEWATVDLQPLLDGEVEHLDPPPTVLARGDGICLLYKGELNWLSGEPETGKSWLAQYGVAQEIGQEHHVLYLDLEDTPSRIVNRLRSLGIDAKAIAHFFHYVRPTVAANEADLSILLGLAARCSLAVIDGTTDLHLIHGLDPEANKDAAIMVARLLRPLANAGPAVLPLDHVTKNKETRGRYAIGAQHKLAAVRGAAYHLETITPMGRGAIGQARLFITKDRPGHIRGTHTLRQGVAKHAAGDFYLDATTPALEARVAPPTEARGYAEAARRKDVLDFVDQRFADLGRGLSLKEIHDGVGGKKDTTNELVRQLAADGELTAIHAGAYPTYAPGGTLE